MNDIRRTPTFKERFHYKQKKAEPDLFQCVCKGIDKLREAAEPERLGSVKKGPLAGVLGMDLIKGSRLLYTVSRRNGRVTVVLLRVCSHKIEDRGLNTSERAYVQNPDVLLPRPMTAIT